ncbi:hypothetical protein Lfu02_49650 [Longispora fulva]|uniref:Uncharacterized protein n=1 Tax=Longispora fulva TaxID=619741 RepID=A0A8J7GIW6_9ACTN|nr:hypothetical protein [Longispora fulva]MBG6138340.1 hypothetical protein [Longispora fulva]GIG60593.1 hypothetical protein Lfu02_49650 [Longispora fulva]
MTATATDPHPPTITQVSDLWPTRVLIKHLPLEGLLSGPIDPAALDGEASCEQVDLAVLLTDPRQVAAVFVEAMRALAAADRAAGLAAPDVTDVAVRAEIWRAGHEQPMHATPAHYTGWLFLHGSPVDHTDSGTVAILDPRAGASMSAVPGLPWGRSLIINPAPGSLAVVPGWLTTSVLPLERTQTSVVLIAESRQAQA